jgi:hypothetical protein
MISRRRFATLPALALCFAVLAAPRAAAEFVPGFEDLPLAPGLTAVPDAAMSFDSAGGRIVESLATGRIDAGSVADFYARTLPQLGWKQADAGTYRREGEELVIEIARSGDALTVRFALAPR